MTYGGGLSIPREPSCSHGTTHSVRSGSRDSLKSRTTILHAYTLHFAKRFSEACSAYREFLLSDPEPHLARIAVQQLDNLRAFDVELQEFPAFSLARLPRRRRKYDEAGIQEDAQQGVALNRGNRQGDEGR